MHHTQTIHDGLRFQCEKCDYQSATNRYLKFHTQSKHDGIGYTCCECDYKATRPHSLKFHMATKHDGEQFRCENVTTKVFQNIHLSFTHSPSMMGLDAYVANVAIKQLRSRISKPIS